MNPSDTSEAFSGWAVVELMGHRKLAGRVSQVTQYGTAMLRLDVPGPDGQVAATQFYSSSAIYCLTPTTEEIAVAFAWTRKPEPVAAWELLSLPAPARSAGRRDHAGEDDDDAGEDDDDDVDARHDDVRPESKEIY